MNGYPIQLSKRVVVWLNSYITTVLLEKSYFFVLPE